MLLQVSTASFNTVLIDLSISKYLFIILLATIRYQMLKDIEFD